jgi:DNA adenine methylase
MNNSIEGSSPFLKWPGGKRWLADTVARLLSSSEGTYFEPFLGGGAVFFRIRPRRAVLTDSNDDLIHAFKTVRDAPDKLISSLTGLRINRSTFDRLRSANPTEASERAARFLYLNRTAFNGLYRVNQKGHFNVPFGCKPGTRLCSATHLLECSRLLAGSSITKAGFTQILPKIRRGQRAYLDPPFTTKHNANAFKRYNESLFSWADQIQLAMLANDMASRGVHVVVSNAFHSDVLRLYSRDVFSPFSVRRANCLAATPEHRGQSTELVLVSKNIAECHKYISMSDSPNRLTPIKYLQDPSTHAE